MVGHIDIHTLNLEELTGVIGLYPWYAAARKELCMRMKESGGLSDSLLAQTALHMCSRRVLFDLIHIVEKPSDDSVMKVLARKEATVQPQPQSRNIFVVGGDYFSQKQYKEAREAGDSIFSSFAGDSAKSFNEEPRQDGTQDICTETLAQIYVEQGYYAEAKSIYSKLSLRYPEKSVYFAALIDKLTDLTDKNN